VRLIVVEGPADDVVLDMGQGSLGALHAVTDPSSLRAVVISHRHADHHVDLIPLRYLLRFGYDEPRSVALHAPAGLRERYDAFLGEPGFLDGLLGPDLEPGPLVLGSLTLEVAPVTHAEPSFAFRVSPTADPSEGLVYSGDCGEWRDLVPLIRPGDTLLSEAFWGTRPPDPGAHHLTAAQAATAARDGGAARLVMTGEVLLAMPGLVVDLEPSDVVTSGAPR
jgi:ribonuclease BN (tRNA processing enzyme)